MLNLDTHILLFALNDELEKNEKKILSSHQWSISSIVLWEIFKLSQLKKIEIDLNDPETIRILSKIHQWPIDIKICQTIEKLDFKGDPADEIISATSLVHNVPLLTRDQQILKSKIVPLAFSVGTKPG